MTLPTFTNWQRATALRFVQPRRILRFRRTHKLFSPLPLSSPYPIPVLLITCIRMRCIEDPRAPDEGEKYAVFEGNTLCIAEPSWRFSTSLLQDRLSRWRRGRAYSLRRLRGGTLENKRLPDKLNSLNGIPEEGRKGKMGDGTATVTRFRKRAVL